MVAGKLKQTAVYWGNPQSNGIGGRTFDEAVEIDVRWEQKQELFIDAAGQETRSNAVVYADQDVDMGGYLFLGELTDLSSIEEGDPLAVDGAYEVRGFGSTPNLKADQSLRKIWL